MRVQRTRSSPSAHREPLTRRRLGGPVIGILILLSCFSASAAAGEDPIVVAERLAYCGPGTRTEIYATGFAHQHVWDTCQGVDRSQLLRITKRQVEAIKTAITAARFCELPSHIKKPESELVSAGHYDFLAVTVQLEALQCNIGAGDDTLEELADQAVPERFRHVWSAITKVVPEPTE